MKMLSALFLFSCALIGVLGAPEAPNAPYPARGWRPQGPAFELPTRSQEVPSQFDSEEDQPETVSDVEVTEEEVQYTGEITTEGNTPFLQYGAPVTDLPEDEGLGTTAAVEADDELTVQGLPGVEAPQQFRALTKERLRRPQKLRQQPQRQKSSRLQAAPAQGQYFQQFQQQFQQQQFQRQQVGYSTTGGYQQAPLQQQQLAYKAQQARNGATFGVQGVSQQFGRFAAPQNVAAKQRVRPAPVFNQRFVQSQRQEALDNTYGAPPQAGAPVQEYGAPAQEYGTPVTQGVPLEEQEVDQPEDIPQEDLPQSEDEETTEANNDLGDDESGNGEVAISNAVASGRYVLLQQQNGRPAKLRSGRAPTAAKLRQPAKLRQITEPIFTYNQFGQLVRIY